MNRAGSSERMGGLVVLKRRKKRGRNLSRIEEKKRKENEHHELTLNVSSDWSKPIEKFSSYYCDLPQILFF